MPGVCSHTLLVSCVPWACRPLTWYCGKHLEHLLRPSQGVSCPETSSNSTTVRSSLVNGRRKYNELEAWEKSVPDSLEGRMEHKPVRAVTRHPSRVGWGVGDCCPAPELSVQRHSSVELMERVCAYTLPCIAGSGQHSLQGYAQVTVCKRHLGMFPVRLVATHTELLSAEN